MVIAAERVRRRAVNAETKQRLHMNYQEEEQNAVCVYFIYCPQNAPPLYHAPHNNTQKSLETTINMQLADQSHSSVMTLCIVYYYAFTSHLQLLDFGVCLNLNMMKDAQSCVKWISTRQESTEKQSLGIMELAKVTVKYLYKIKVLYGENAEVKMHSHNFYINREATR